MEPITARRPPAATVPTTALGSPRRFALALLVVAAAGSAATAAAAEQTRSFTKSFTPASGELLRLANLAGSVEISNATGSTVEVRATVHAEGRDAAETRRLLEGMSWVKDPSHPGGWALSYPVREHSRFRYPQPGGLRGWSTSNTQYLGRKVTISGRGDGPVLYVDLAVSYPPSSGVAIRNSMGAIRGGDLYGQLSLDTGSADITLGAFNGKLDVDTGSGDIRLAGLRGEGSLDTGSGDVTIAHVDAEKVGADTGSGDVAIGSAQGAEGWVRALSVDTGSGDVEVRNVAVETADLDTGSGDVLLSGSLARARSVRADTGSGDVEIYGGPDASFDVVADQGSGDLRVGYADARLRHSRHKVIGAERGDRRTRIVIDTGSGDAVIAPSR